ncbi:hypothetical protein P3T23_009779, partial [Paraburkholderia sp. GAS448]|uniref:hypothetical protein n=1 Tax=Paraburkholderia sp. GAS448 TaxID=3035136 RepID=UPI003D22FA9F
SSSGSLLPAIMTDSRPSFSTQRTVRILGATSNACVSTTSITRKQAGLNTGSMDLHPATWLFSER